jgi:hypothetical protein
VSAPVLLSIAPASGPAGGGDLVLLKGEGFAAGVSVLMGGAPASLLWVRDQAGVSLALARTPPRAEGSVDVALQNLDGGAPVPGELALLPSAYRFLRARIVQEHTLTRLVRALLRELKRQVLENTSLSVALDFDDTPLDALDVVAIGKLPSVVLTGPRLRENRSLSTNVPVEELVAGASGLELRRRRPPLTVDVEFAVTGASQSAVELLNLISAIGAFFNRTRWLEMLRDPDEPARGVVRWELDSSGECRTGLEGKDDIRAFAWGLVIRGLDLDEGLPLDLGRAVEDDPSVTITSYAPP